MHQAKADKIKAVICGLLFSSVLFSCVVYAGGLDLSGNLNSNIQINGMIVNLGMAQGAGSTSAAEVSIGSTHNNLKILGDYSSAISINGAQASVSVLNATLGAGGAEGTCAKVSIGSISPSVCKNN